MSQAEDLRHFQKYAEDILKQFEKYDSAIQNQLYQEDRALIELRSKVKTIRKQAKNVKDSTSSEVKIAVMGEFNATKTTLLGSLLGYVGKLPESDVATTGNVTHLRIVQVKGSESTQFQFAVEYFDLPEINECLDFMLRQLAKKASEARLLETQIAKLRSLTSKDTNVWGNTISWCQESLQSDSTPGLKQAIKELEVFAESYRRYGRDVCGKPDPIIIDEDTARSGLQLPSDSADVLKLKFDQVPQDKQRLSEFLRATFPLIRRINVEVKVSDKIWNLSSIQGANKLVLLDFPGLGASKSELRDQFLTVREMKNVQTILILLDSTRPGGAKNYEIFDLLRQQRFNENIDDFILAGAGRFDDLLNKAEKDIDKLLDSNEPITEQKIFQEIPTLQEVVKSARDSTKGRDDRIVLLSAFVALEYARRNLDSTIEIATPRTWEKLSKFQNSFPILHEKWKLLSERLKKSQPDSVLVTWLDTFVKDGGVTQLRHLLENHVATHGLDQLYKDARAKVKALCDEQKDLQQRLNNPSLRELIASENPNLSILRQTIQKLANSYENLKNYLERNPLDLGIGLTERRDEVSLRQKVSRRVKSDIFGWNQWRNLLSIAENGSIRLEQRIDDDEDDDDIGPLQLLINERQNTVCTVSDDFYDPFKESCERLEKYTNEHINQAIEDWLNELSNGVVFLKETQTEINVKQLRDEIESCVQKKAELQGYIEALLYAAFPSQWKQRLLKRVEKNSLPSINPETLFPLPLEDSSKGEPRLIFDWSPDKKRTNPISENHLITILQLRDAMIDNVRDKLVQFVTYKSQRVNETLRKSSLEEAIKALNDTLDNRALLRQMVGEEKSEGNVPDWLEALQEVVNIRCPL